MTNQTTTYDAAYWEKIEAEDLEELSRELEYAQEMVWAERRELAKNSKGILDGQTSN